MHGYDDSRLFPRLDDQACMKREKKVTFSNLSTFCCSSTTTCDWIESDIVVSKLGGALTVSTVHSCASLMVVLLAGDQLEHGKTENLETEKLEVSILTPWGWERTESGWCVFNHGVYTLSTVQIWVGPLMSWWCCDIEFHDLWEKMSQIWPVHGCNSWQQVYLWVPSCCKWLVYICNLLQKTRGQFVASWLRSKETNFNNISFSAHFSVKNKGSRDSSDQFSQATRIVNGRLIHGLSVCMCPLYSTCEQAPSCLIPDAAAGNKMKTFEILTVFQYVHTTTPTDKQYPNAPHDRNQSTW